MKCIECLIEKDISEFNFRNKSKGIRYKFCRDCSKKKWNNQYSKNKEYYLNKQKKIRKRLRGDNSQKIWDYLKSHPCIKCGETNPILLEFDHLRDKKYNVSHMIKDYSWSSILKEIDKCQVLCVTCHRLKTAEDFGWYKNVTK